MEDIKTKIEKGTKKETRKKLVKNYPLLRQWTLWFDMPTLHNSYTEYKDDLKWLSKIEKVNTFDSIGKFWRLFNNVKPVNMISYKSAYYLFEHNTNPFWRDINNLSGCNLVFTINGTKNPLEDEFIDEIWQMVILSFIGENIDYSSYVSGFSLKKNKYTYDLSLCLRVQCPEAIGFFTNYITNIVMEKIPDNHLVMIIESIEIIKNKIY